MKICFHCNKRLRISEKPPRDESCPFCDSDLKVCLNCKFYDKFAYNKCREPAAERVLVKDKANFCEYFCFRDAPSTGRNSDSDRGLMEELNGLFNDF